tara:strand:- start:323 stop:508 length:186 start_codon:yes stop_codon:yes gene_type:complete
MLYIMNRKKVNPFAHKTRRYRWVYDLDHILHELVFLDTAPYNPRIISIPTDYHGLEEVFFV